MFKVVSVRGNSVRIKTGLVTFDVTIETIDGKLWVRIPKGIFMFREDYEMVVRAAKDAFINTTDLLGDTTNEVERVTDIRDR